MNKVCDKYGFKGIDCSALIRKAADYDKEIKAMVDAGKLVKSDDVVNLLINEMDDNEASVYIIKGFPKS
jgi:adenylate kinase family enzyme